MGLGAMGEKFGRDILSACVEAMARSSGGVHVTGVVGVAVRDRVGGVGVEGVALARGVLGVLGRARMVGVEGERVGSHAGDDEGGGVLVMIHADSPSSAPCSIR